MKFVAVIQCTEDDFLSFQNFKNFNSVIPVLKNSKFFSNIVLAIGSKEKTINKKILKICKFYKIDFYQGDQYNPLKRIINSSKKFKPNYVSRFLLRQFYLDLEQFEYSYKKVLKYNLDTIFYPADFNYSFIGDIFKFESLVNISKNINNLKNELLKHSYQLTPSIYFQDNQKKFKTKVSEIVIKNYSPKKVSLIKKKFKKLLDGENQIKANTKSKSSYYNFTKKFIKKCDFLADIACGQGDGFVNLSSISKKSIGYDKNKKYIYAAEQKYKKIKNIEFRKIKAPFILDKEKFDVVTSFHTLEHLEKKEHQNFIRNIFNSLKKKGKFFLEVPLLLKRPLGEPLLPVHLHEPSFNELSSRLIKNGFNIKKAMVKDRHRYYDVKIAKNGNILSHQTKLKVCGYFYCTKK